MNKVLEIKKFYIIIFIISLFSLLIALYIEFFLGYLPCKLCIYQRVPYLIAIFVTFFGVSYYKNLFWLYALLIIFLSSIIVSGYHFGIEQEIFKEFSGCTNNSLNIMDKKQLLEFLNSEINTCKNVEFKLFGLSLAAINLSLSLIIFLFILFFIKY